MANYTFKWLLSFSDFIILSIVPKVKISARFCLSQITVFNQERKVQIFDNLAYKLNFQKFLISSESSGMILLAPLTFL